MPTRHFLVGTFNTSRVFTLAFDPDAAAADERLKVARINEGEAPHSWLALSHDKTRLYATSWTTPPGLASYAVSSPSSSGDAPSVSFLNSVLTAARSGYVCVSATHAYSAGGPTGEVFALNSETGGFEGGKEVQKLDFVGETSQKDDGSTMDFGGLRHGSHSFDLSPDGKLAYVADIGRNAIFVFRVLPSGLLELTDKSIAPRAHDGPRHVTPHPDGRYVYSLQEHSSMVDVFEVDRERGTLGHVMGVKIIPEDHDCKEYWADEVRVSPSGRYLYCSTRGLLPSRRGWVAVFALSSAGLPSSSPLALWETPTSGGWANAVEPAPAAYNDAQRGVEYVALTDSEEGLVMVLGWDGEKVEEVGRVRLPDGAGAATAVWL
ncbi:hypothetical protein JCM10207_005119 [Rhodosporidiobolus poonsookiae]